MATLSSHLLNSVNGTHAEGVKVIIYQINPNGDIKKFFETETTKDGRILKDFDLSKEDCECDYEMICKTADYFSEKKIVSEISVKFRMEDPNKKYHRGSGQSSDSLAVGNREGVLDAQLDFARSNSNIILEFKIGCCVSKYCVGTPPEI